MGNIPCWVDGVALYAEACAYWGAKFAGTSHSRVDSCDMIFTYREVWLPTPNTTRTSLKRRCWFRGYAHGAEIC